MENKKDRNSCEVLSCFSRGHSRKRGQQMALGTIIAIVLGLVVLVFLIYGFSTGWGNMWEKITGLGGGDVNVATISTACTLACQQENQQGYCVQERNVVLNEGGAEITRTCRQLGEDGIVDKCLGLANDKVCVKAKADDAAADKVAADKVAADKVAADKAAADKAAADAVTG